HRSRTWPFPSVGGRGASRGSPPRARGNAGRTPQPRDLFPAEGLPRTRPRFARTGPPPTDCCRSSSDSLDASWHALEHVFESLQGPNVAVDGRGRLDLQDLGRLLVAQLLEVPQDQHLLVVGGHVVDRLLDAD